MCNAISIDDIRESNASARSLVGLVVVFVGGTGGIGESTARELFQRTTRPKAYIIGRSDKMRVGVKRQGDSRHLRAVH